MDEKGETGRLLSALEKIVETINYQYYWKHRIVGASGLEGCKPGKGGNGADSAENLKQI